MALTITVFFSKPPGPLSEYQRLSWARRDRLPLLHGHSSRPAEAQAHASSSSAPSGARFTERQLFPRSLRLPLFILVLGARVQRGHFHVVVGVVDVFPVGLGVPDPDQVPQGGLGVLVGDELALPARVEGEAGSLAVGVFVDDLAERPVQTSVYPNGAQRVRSLTKRIAIPCRGSL